MRILQHGIIWSTPGHPLGYFGWPSVALSSDNRLVVVESGFRNAHIDPFGKTVMHLSNDLGRTWLEPIIINDSPIDDRDAGVVTLPDGDMLISWFTSDTRRYPDKIPKLDITVRQAAQETINRWTDELVNNYLGGFIRIGTPEKGFSPPLEIGVTAPHGPIVRSDGSLLYLGKAYWGTATLPPVQGMDHPEADHSYRRDNANQGASAPIYALESRDKGRNWTFLGQVPLSGDITNANLHEPHVIELADGGLLGVIRAQNYSQNNRCPRFGLVKTFSWDGGHTWTPVEDMNVYGSPPHLVRHPLGAIICVYGYRNLDHILELADHGQRAILSLDEGKTWSEPLVLRDDGPTISLGYPSSVVLPDGSLYTVYYQRATQKEKPSIMYTRWTL